MFWLHPRIIDISILCTLIDSSAFVYKVLVVAVIMCSDPFCLQQSVVIYRLMTLWPDNKRKAGFRTFNHITPPSIWRATQLHNALLLSVNCLQWVGVAEQCVLLYRFVSESTCAKLYHPPPLNIGNTLH